MLYLQIGIGLFLLGNIFFFWCKSQKNYGLVDIAWGLSFLVTSIICFFNSSKNIHHILILSMITIWSLRLSIYLSIRNIGETEDFRYHQMRKNWGKHADLQAYFKVFTLQPLLSFIVSLPLIMAFQQSNFTLSFQVYLGIAIFLFGITFESIADYTLYHFKKDPINKGKILTRSVWKFCRHPNYFGEMTLWWGIFIASGQFFITPWTIIGPMLISFLLIKVSGVPLLEEHYKNNLAYQEYVLKTNSFIPWFPKNK